jgi:3-oxoacyl-[acyl-carrier protein] reductase
MLNGQVAIVTGASRGIGAAILSALAKANATVIGTATSEKGAEGITKAIAGEGAKGGGRVLDVRDAAQCASFVEAVQAEFGAPAILVNNAGVTRDNLLARMKDEEWDDIQSTNLKSVFLLSRAVLRGMMKARSGRIVNITSGGGLHRQRRPGQLCGGEGGHGGLLEVARARGGQPQHHRELRGAGLHRDGHDARARPGAGEEAGGERAARASSGKWRTSRRRCSSSALRALRTSPAPPSM